ncbi:competence/damage-inducible protein A [Youxingia wuxianensis]|uniref:Putative competence-damage inducible protein n=1 Tax=Youxingia wuxianensis TaxID=2763678 RepID=A0A926ERK8_9FIRM|nr:competence/damage-inducible protein A [Youxingia wuxianensis]MBC8586416.1 competence/damage-inducible protein A [Youxingia wuxianensis]
MKKDSAEILCVGTEILLGNIVNTNSAVISRGLAQLGINMYHHTVVGDNPQRLKEALEIAFSRNNIVITTGGLGPTYDDLTKETIAEYFGVPLELHSPSLVLIKDFFKRIGREMTENNIKQALLPKGCIVLENHNGTAPGAIIEGEGRTAVMLPGPPREMEPMFREQVMPYLEKRSQQVLRSHCVYFFGIGESALEQQLRERMISMENPTLAPYAKDGEVMLRVTASAKDEMQAEALLKPAVDQLVKEFPTLIYGVDVDNLQTAAVGELSKKGLKVATAESCTGGYISKRITEVAGSSQVFDCGVTSYANEIKEKVLGVSHETLQTYGAVSPQTAREMAQGVRELAGADIGVSTTGIAGPGGGTPEKPVGLVYVGVSSPWHSEVITLHLARGNYDNERELIRYLAASHALHLVIKTAKLK